MRIGGLQETTLIDYPGKIAATVFTCGCNFRCPFCHNPELVLSEQFNEVMSLDDFFVFLKKRQGLLDGVCITGGEPTIYEDLGEVMKKIKDLGFLVKLDTNGSYPEKVKKYLKDKIIDFIAMDIKSSPDKYVQLVQDKDIIEKVKESVELIKNNLDNYEFRTTLVPGFVELKDMENIGKWLKGSKSIVLQQFWQDKTLDPNWQSIKPYSKDKIEEFEQIAQKYFEKVKVRGLR